MTFPSFFSFFCANLAIPTKKVHFRLYLQTLNQNDQEHVTFLSQINYLEAHCTHCGDKLLAFFLIRFLQFLPLAHCQYCLQHPFENAIRRK